MRDSKGRFAPRGNQQVTDLGISHKIDGRVIDITDTAMQRQTRLSVERKYEDRQIIREAKILMGIKARPDFIVSYIEQRVSESKYNDVVPAR